MVRAITTRLTLVAMLWHAALGCSWHHAHASEGFSCTAAASCCKSAKREIAATRHSHDAAGHKSHEPLHGAAPQTGDGQAPADRHLPADCFEGECKYLRAADGEQLTPDRDLDGDAFEAVDSAATVELVVVRGDASLAALTALPYLPRCETKQVWQI
jgi:hypothetical protein